MRLALDPKRKQRVATLPMIASLGAALFIGGCGHHNGGDQSSANGAPNSGQTTGSTTTGGPTATDVSSTMNDLNASLSGLDSDISTANVDYSSQDQEVQP